MLKCKTPINYEFAGKAVAFLGRDLVSSDGAIAEERAIEAGVASRRADGTLFYNGILRARLKDGRKLNVGDDNLVDAALEDIDNSAEFEEVP